MKYIVARQFSLTKDKFDIILHEKVIASVKASSAQGSDDRYSLKFSDKSEKQREEKSCVVVPDPNHPQSYLIFLKDPISRETRRFGQLTYERTSRNNYHYRIIIGKNLYQLQSLELKDRYLTMIDSIYLGNNPWDSSFASTLCQVSDQFCKSTKNFHVTVSHSENAFGYIALVILLCLYESKREYLR